jgi:hypothetical protein
LKSRFFVAIGIRRRWDYTDFHRLREMDAQGVSDDVEFSDGLLR